MQVPLNGSRKGCLHSGRAPRCLGLANEGRSASLCSPDRKATSGATNETAIQRVIQRPPFLLTGRDCSKLGLVRRQHSLSNERNQDALHERACCAGGFDDEDGAPTFFGEQHRSCAKCTPIL